MSAVKERIPLHEAEALSREVVRFLEPLCERIEVLGSIRRGRADVGDIEIGVIPKIGQRQVGLFGDDEPVNLQLDFVQTEIAFSDDVWLYRFDKNGHKCCGMGCQRLLYKGFALDIFGTVEPEAWGVLKLIRTGSSDFNQRVVRQKVEGGTVLPLGMRFEGGRLIDRGIAVSTPEEEDVFRAIGMAFVEPHRRDA